MAESPTGWASEFPDLFQPWRVPYVVEVAVLPVASAITFLAPSDPIHADVLRLAERMGLV